MARQSRPVLRGTWTHPKLQRVGRPWRRHHNQPQGKKSRKFLDLCVQL